MSDGLSLIQAVLQSGIQVYLFLARPGLVLIPLAGVGLVVIVGRWRYIRPPQRAARRLILEHLVLGLLCAAAAVCLVLLGDGYRRSAVLHLLWQRHYALFLPACSVLGLVVHIVLFRFGELEDWDPPARVGYVLVNGTVAASVCLSAVYLSLDDYARVIVCLAVATGGLAWHVYQRPATSRISRIAGSLGVDIGQWRMAWTVTLLAVLAPVVAAFLVLLVASDWAGGVPYPRTALLQSSVFALSAGGTVLALVGVLVSGVIVMSGVVVKAFVAALTGAFWSVTAFVVLVVPVIGHLDETLISLFQVVLACCLGVILYLLVGQRLVWPLTLFRGNLVIVGPAARRPSEYERRRTAPTAESSDMLFRLADFIAWVILLAGKQPVVEAPRALVKACARDYLSDLGEAQFEELFRAAICRVLTPNWVYEVGTAYALTDFAYRFLWPPADDPRAVDIAVQCLKARGRAIAEIDPQSLDRAGWFPRSGHATA